LKNHKGFHTAHGLSAPLYFSAVNEF